MFSKLFGHQQSSLGPSTYSVPDIGLFTYDPKEQLWRTVLKGSNHRLDVQVDGKQDAPYPELLAGVKAAIRNVDSIFSNIKNLLTEEAARSEWSKWNEDIRAEILQLTPAALYFFKRDAPHDATLLLQPGNNYRMWSCEYDNGRVYALHFDT